MRLKITITGHKTYLGLFVKPLAQDEHRFHTTEDLVNHISQLLINEYNVYIPAIKKKRASPLPIRESTPQ